METGGAIEYLTDASRQEMRLGLSRMDWLMGQLGNPEQKCRYIHVAGTNGKGSVCAMLASVLTQAGYKTGMYTSPYINFFNERISVNGEPIPSVWLDEITEKVGRIADKMEDRPTEFELVTAIALEYFYRAGCDIVVVEVGLGGSLDATNIIPVPEVGVITAIAVDHQEVLGDTPDEIALHKGGIIKPGGEIVLMHQGAGVEKVIEKICHQQGAKLTLTNPTQLVQVKNDITGQVFSYGGLTNLEIPLLGEYQLQNVAVVLTILQVLQAKGWNIEEEPLRRGLKKVSWPARFEIVHTHPVFIVDGGHNLQCVNSLVKNLEVYFPGKKITFLIGVMADKAYEEMFRLILPYAKRIVTVTPDNPRALPAKKLAEFFKQTGFSSVTSCESIEEGIEEIYIKAGREEILCAFGSFYMAGAIRKYFMQEAENG